MACAFAQICFHKKKQQSTRINHLHFINTSFPLLALTLLMQKVISMQMFLRLCGCGMLYPLFGWGNKLTLKIELVGASRTGRSISCRMWQIAWACCAHWVWTI